MEAGSVDTLKVLCALASFVLAGVGCWLARRLETARGTRGPLTMKLLVGGNTLASGILLAAALVHMLPDATEALKGVTKFPLASVIAGSAFCFLVVLGEAVGGCMPQRNEPHTQTACVAYEASFAIWPRWELVPPHGCDGSGPCADGSSKAGPLASPAPSDSSSYAGGLEEGSGHDGHTGPGCCKHRLLKRPSAPFVEEAVLQCYEAQQVVPDKGHSCHSHSSCCRVHRHSDAPCSTAALPEAAKLRGPGVDSSSTKTPLLAEHVHELPGECHAGPAARLAEGDGGLSQCHVRAVGGGPMAEAKSYLLFFALCFHSVMEGLGMGSARSSSMMLPVTVAILAHKGLAAFALGCSLTQSDLQDFKFWAFVFIFSSGTPIGCLIGAAFSGLGTASQSVASGVCIALASGTFLQVSSMELLPRVLAEDKHKALAGCSLFTGFLAMSLLAMWC